MRGRNGWDEESECVVKRTVTKQYVVLGELSVEVPMNHDMVFLVYVAIYMIIADNMLPIHMHDLSDLGAL
jgi:hypothetical protein